MGSVSLVAARNQTAEQCASLAPTAPTVMTALAAKAGFRFNGDNPWDVHVSDQRLYRRILAEGSLGFGEAYMDCWHRAQSEPPCQHSAEPLAAPSLVRATQASYIFRWLMSQSAQYRKAAQYGVGANNPML